MLYMSMCVTMVTEEEAMNFKEVERTQEKLEGREGREKLCKYSTCG